MSKSDPFEDSDRPFMPGDNLPKPNKGDILIIKDMPEINDGTVDRVKVLNVYDSLAEDWGCDGESAWTQHDVNDTVGHRGHWYAIVCNIEFEDETWSVASWEVERIEIS